jgi:hypothetical protein
VGTKNTKQIALEKTINLANGPVSQGEYQECAIDDVADVVTEVLVACTDALDEVSKKVDGGIVADLAIGTAAGITKAIVKDADTEEVVETALETVVPFGEAVTELSEGNEEGAIIAATSDVASLAGGIGLSKIFAAAGTAAGLISGAPIVGTIALGTTGLLVGSIASGLLTEKFLENNPKIVQKAENGICKILESVGVDTHELDKKYESFADTLNKSKDRFFNKITSLFNSSAENNYGDQENDRRISSPSHAAPTKVSISPGV